MNSCLSTNFEIYIVKCFFYQVYVHGYTELTCTAGSWTLLKSSLKPPRNTADGRISTLFLITLHPYNPISCWSKDSLPCFHYGILQKMWPLVSSHLLTSHSSTVGMCANRLSQYAVHLCDRCWKNLINQELLKPLNLIFRKSLEEAKVPDNWKKAWVSAIHKKGSKAQAGNYRPVSIISIVCKILEKIGRNHIVSHFKDNKLFTTKQFGFMEGQHHYSS